MIKLFNNGYVKAVKVGGQDDILYYILDKGLDELSNGVDIKLEPAHIALLNNLYDTDRVIPFSKKIIFDDLKRDSKTNLSGIKTLAELEKTLQLLVKQGILRSFYRDKVEHFYCTDLGRNLYDAQYDSV